MNTQTTEANQFHPIMYSQENNLIGQSAPVNSAWTSDNHWMLMETVSNGLDEIFGLWQKLNGAVPGNTDDAVKVCHVAVDKGLDESETVENDLHETETGRVELPDAGDNYIGEELSVKVNKETESVVNSGSGSKPREKDRKKATPWTVDEHRKFLEGLETYGKGDWRSISRNMVPTRTATQVASHAQKYFIRQTPQTEENNNKRKRKKKRYSIHDITTTDVAVVVHAQPTSSAPPITSSPADFSGGQVCSSQERGAQSSVTVAWPSVQDITTTTDTTMRVHAQPMPSTPPAAAVFYSGKGKGVAAEVAATTFYDRQYYGGKGKGVATTSSSTYFYDRQYYGGQGGGAQPSITLSPDGFYGGQGGGARAPQPFSSFYDGQGGEEPQPLSGFYGGQGGAPPPYEFNYNNKFG